MTENVQEAKKSLFQKPGESRVHGMGRVEERIEKELRLKRMQLKLPNS